MWCVAYGRTSGEAWTTPVEYRGDAWFLLAYLKAAQDGHVFPGASLTVPELNAPFDANWNDHPRPLRAVFFLAGLLSRRLGLFFTANLLLLLSHVLAALSFYAVARYFRARWEWAGAGALAFGLSHFLFWRSLEHLDLALCWHVPLCVLVVTWALGRRGIRLRSRRFAAAATIPTVTALHNPYYACLFAQFLLFAAIAQAIRPGDRRRALAPLGLLMLLTFVFALDQAGALAYQWRHGANSGALRPYSDLARYALKPIELVIPHPGFGLADWGTLARAYWERRDLGEGGSPYLGLVGAGTLLWLGLIVLLGVLRRPAKAPPATFAAVAWIVLYSMVGGVNQFVGLTGFVWLRATNRYSVWILALVLLFLVTRRSRSVAGAGSLAGALFVAAVAVADQVPRGPRREDPQQTRLTVEADRQFVRSLESLLPPGSMLFMLPVTDFPEGRPVRRATEYEHLRPYLFSERLRFSFGSDKGRPREAWQRVVERLPAADMAQALERYGFAGIVVNRPAYQGAAVDLLAELRAEGRPVVEAAGDFVCVRLQPAAVATRPQVPVLFGRGYQRGRTLEHRRGGVDLDQPVVTPHGVRRLVRPRGGRRPTGHGPAPQARALVGGRAGDARGVRPEPRSSPRGDPGLLHQRPSPRARPGSSSPGRVPVVAAPFPDRAPTDGRRAMSPQGGMNSSRGKRSWFISSSGAGSASSNWRILTSRLSTLRARSGAR